MDTHFEVLQQACSTDRKVEVKDPNSGQDYTVIPKKISAILKDEQLNVKMKKEQVTDLLVNQPIKPFDVESF